MDIRTKLANEIALLSYQTGSNSVPHLQELLGYQPLMMHNAITQGLEDGKFTKYDRKKGLVTVDPELELSQLQLTPAVMNMSVEIEYFIREANSREWDITLDELQLQLMLADSVHINMAIFVNSNLATYELSPPKDKKTRYVFVTLKGNEGKLWGTKQLKEGK